MDYNLEKSTIEEKIKLIESTKLPDEVLEKLANDTDFNVRESVAYHCFTPEYILDQLAEDKFDAVRMSVAINGNTSLEVIQKLLEDDNEYVRFNASQNMKLDNQI